MTFISPPNLEAEKIVGNFDHSSSDYQGIALNFTIIVAVPITPPGTS